MDVVTDIILLLSSGAATIYCFILSRRLARLNDTKNGLGASIASMSQALAQMQEALIAARGESDANIQRLSLLIEESRRVQPEISRLMREMEKLSVSSVRDIEDAGECVMSLVEDLLSIDEHQADTVSPARRTPAQPRRAA